MVFLCKVTYNQKSVRSPMMQFRYEWFHSMYMHHNHIYMRQIDNILFIMSRTQRYVSFCIPREYSL